MQDEVTIKPDRAAEEDSLRAEVALKLLRSVAEAHQSPEQFEKACLDWAQHSESVKQIPEFWTIMESLQRSSGTLLSSSNPGVGKLDAIRVEDFFFLRKNGTVSDISLELSNLLQLRPGDAIAPTLLGTCLQGEGKISRSETTEIVDAFGINRRLIVYPTLRGAAERRYTARLIRFSLSASLRRQLTNLYGLTESEQDVLELSLRRYKPDRIAKLRRNSLNTVRTHINRILQKMKCHSLAEAMSDVVELSLIYEAENLASSNIGIVPFGSARKVAIPEQQAIVEYSRYGPISGRPCLVLHSTEYGYTPTPDFIAMAKDRNVCLYFPRRPGYGDTTSLASLPEIGELIANFIKALDLSDVVVAGISMSAPVALHTPNRSGRISQVVLMNYGLNAESKISTISPKWIRGLITMAIDNSTGFSIGLEAIRTVFRSVGISRLYKRLYSKLDVDLSFYKQNEYVFEQSGRYLLGADGLNIRLDLMTSFMHLENLDKLIGDQKALIVANGEIQHKVAPNAAEHDAKRLGISFKTIPNAGRNWMFDQPREFFDLIVHQKSETA